MPSQHRNAPIPFRPPAAERDWLVAYASQAGLPVNRVLTELVRAEMTRQASIAEPGQYVTWKGTGADMAIYDDDDGQGQA